MFNFLNSAVLLAAAAALIPLLIHLFSRRRVKVVEFSSLKHLKEMQKRQVRRLKLRQLLLLLLRMLIILAAVLAFARPATKGGYLGSHAGVSAVMLFDCSASMQRQVRDGNLFDLAKNKVGEILDNFGESDEIVLIPFDRAAHFPSGERFFSAEAAKNILNELQQGYDEGNLGAALDKGLEMLGKASNLNKELYIVSDRQLNSLPDSVSRIPEGIEVFIVDIPNEIEGNDGIVGLDMGGQLIEAGSPFTIKTEIQNYENIEKTEQLASLFMDGARVMQTEFQIGPDGKAAVSFNHSVSNPGFHQGYIQLSDDDMSFDNNFYFSFRIPEQVNVLIIDGDGGGEIVGLALNPSPEMAQYWSVKTVSPNELASIQLRGYDVIVVSGVESFGGAEASRLFRFVDDGGGLFYIHGASSNLNFFNTYMKPRTDFEFLKTIPQDFSGAGYYTAERFDYSHPIFKPFAKIYKENVPTFRFFALPAVRDGNSNRDLFYFSNGMPAAVEANLGLGRTIVFASPILPKYTDLASHSFFVPFIIRTIEYLANDISTYEANNFVGENILRTIPGKSSRYEIVDMITPDGRNYSIAGIEKSGQMIYDCRPIDVPGLYRLEGNGRIVDIFPVNVAVSEGNPETAAVDRFASAIRLENYRTIPYSEKSNEIITQARYGRELWKLFLWAGAVLMMVEMVFSREKADTDEMV